MRPCLFLSLSLAGLIFVPVFVEGDGGSDSTNNPSSGLQTTMPSVLEPSTAVSTLSTDDLEEYADQPEAVKQLISQGLALTRLKLSYKYGSSDPKNGGMDCSGTVYWLLNQSGVGDVPRDASGMYEWVWRRSHFQSVISLNPKTFELDRLKPGDLLFWTGTYPVKRDPPITHVMIYLGINRQNGRRVMLGASEGRPFNGKPRYGVSVFDFELPGARLKPSLNSDISTMPEMNARFIGYGSVPGLGDVRSHDMPTGPSPSHG